MSKDISAVETAIAELRLGHFIIVDDEHREAEGDLVIAAQFATEEKLAFMVRYTSGIICVPMASERLQQLRLPLMVAELDNEEHLKTAFTISVDAASSTTGISAAERATTIALLADPAAQPESFVRPGHIFPLREDFGGLESRRGHTEASLALLRAAGCEPVAAISELTNDNGIMMDRTDLARFAQAHNIASVTIDEVVDALIDSTQQNVARLGR